MYYVHTYVCLLCKMRIEMDRNRPISVIIIELAGIGWNMRNMYYENIDSI